MAYLESWKSKQAVVLAKYSIAQTENTPIVHSVHITEKDGGKKAQAGRVDGHNFSRWFRDFCVDNGFGSYEIIDKTFVRNGRPITEAATIRDWSPTSSGIRMPRCSCRPELTIKQCRRGSAMRTRRRPWRSTPTPWNRPTEPRRKPCRIRRTTTKRP